MGDRLYSIKIEKNKISKDIEKDFLFDIDIKQLAKKIEDTATIEEVKKFYQSEDLYFPPQDIPGNLWEYRKKETTPRIWRGVYKYADVYGKSEWKEPAAKFEYNTDQKNINILDFGAGADRKPQIYTDKNYYLVELNNWTFYKLKEYYKNMNNVFVFQNLSDVLSVKFDLIWSHDALEHVRLLNEHLNILYRICNRDGILDLHISSQGECGGGHVYGIFKDSLVRKPYNLIFREEADI